MQNPESVQAHFEEAYAGNPPWEIGRPQTPFIEAADQVTGRVLDAGCGTGNTSLFFAERGLRVTGIDFVEEAIRQARAKSVDRGQSVEFLVKDALTLDSWDERFASVIDSGLFHIYHGDDQRRYVQGLANVLEPGGRLFLLCFSQEETMPDSGATPEELPGIFAEGWEVESVRLTRGEGNPAYRAEHPERFPEGGPKMLFAIIRRTD